MCSACYQRHRSRGTLGQFQRTLHQTIDDWLADIDTSDEDACWPWPGFRNEDGYGIAWNGTRMANAHRVVWERRVGPIPEGMTLDHMCHDSDVCQEGRSCPHRPCVNPGHLALATHVDNARRSLAGRRACGRGHEQTDDNVIRRNGRTWCRLCRNANGRRSEKAKRIAAGSRTHARSGYCINDHELTPENTYVHPRTGYKGCRTCRQTAYLRARERRMAKRLQD